MIAKGKSRILFLIKFSNMRLKNDAYNVFMAFLNVLYERRLYNAMYIGQYSKQRVRVTFFDLI